MTTQKTTIKNVIASLLSFHKTETSFNQTKDETYSNIVSFMLAEGMTLIDLSTRIAEHSKTWPTDNGEKVGRGKAIKAGCVEAIAFHRFQSWASLNLEKENGTFVTDEKGEPVRKDKTKKEKGATARKDNKAGKCTTIEGKELLAIAFKEMATLIEQRRGKVSKRAQIAEVEEMSAMLAELQDFIMQVAN